MWVNDQQKRFCIFEDLPELEGLQWIGNLIQHEMHFKNLFVHNENLNNTAVFLFRFSLFICFYLCFNWKLYAWTCEAIKWIKFIFQNSCQVYVWHIGKVHKQQTTDTIIIVLYSNFFWWRSMWNEMIQTLFWVLKLWRKNKKIMSGMTSVLNIMLKTKHSRKISFWFFYDEFFVINIPLN